MSLGTPPTPAVSRCQTFWRELRSRYVRKTWRSCRLSWRRLWIPWKRVNICLLRADGIALLCVWLRISCLTWEKVHIIFIIYPKLLMFVPFSSSTVGTREQAFVQSLASSALVLNVARAFGSGELPQCRRRGRSGQPSTTFKCSGCRDSIVYAGRFAQLFTSVNLLSIINSTELFKNKVDLHNYAVGRTVSRLNLSSIFNIYLLLPNHDEIQSNSKQRNYLVLNVD